MYEYRSIILTSNKDFTSWGELFIDENVAVPVVDRLIHHSHIFMLGGESYRLRQKLSTQQLLGGSILLSEGGSKLMAIDTWYNC